jgi:hypothetical protein
MEKKTENFLNKIKFDTMIYAITFCLVAVGYSVKHANSGPEGLMLLLAAFAFFTVGKQVRVAAELEGGADLDNKPKAPAWVRGVTYFVVLLLVLTVIFS